MNHENLNRFVQLFTLSDAEATQRVSERLALVLRDPAAYQEQDLYADELEQRGIVTELPAQELRDIALIDALSSEGLAWESSMREPTETLAEGLNEVLVIQKRTEVAQLVLASRRNTGPEVLDYLQDALEPMGLALVLLTLDSDSYPLSVVAEDQVEHTRRLAKELGFKLVVY
ncbi:hypothetical protein BEN47_19395 [Hymenobacter lapidarius]|uniref:DUF6630 domain-containing protein n=1 Tax=Hymenobacter lapidarius TaxID=1908237 RepID=A0A1G1SR53_9BACT|nr:hypothetical protein [Hymenobacter lapidarius]OGX81111.1 hypothetical protein BEN47_19395 [Hymenobacter lapidarius]